MPLDIILDREANDFIQRMVDSKRYVDASDVVMHAIVLLEDKERAADLRRAEFFAKIDEGLASADRGELIDAEDVFAEMEALIAEKEAPAGGKDAAA